MAVVTLRTSESLNSVVVVVWFFFIVAGFYVLFHYIKSQTSCESRENRITNGHDPCTANLVSLTSPPSCTLYPLRII